MAIRPSCAGGLTLRGASTCSRSPRTRPCSRQSTIFEVPEPRDRGSRPAEDPTAAGPQARADRRADRQPRRRAVPDGHVPRRARRRADDIAVLLSCGSAPGTSGRRPASPPREEWLIAEWPEGKDKPSDYWLSNLPADTKPERLARLARLRWKIELDYKQLKGELGLDHYEGRSWLGWYHHTALVTAAHGFLTLERQHPNHQRPA